jgi:hypothetical protein
MGILPGWGKTSSSAADPALTFSELPKTSTGKPLAERA